MTDLSRATAALQGKQRMLAFTGAGISTESGIPDFRGPDGVWTKVDPSEFTYDKFVNQASTRIKSWERAREHRRLDAKPNPGHHALVKLWKAGHLIGCVTQNVDGLHQKAGLPDEAVIELHGNAHSTTCLNCRRSWPTPDVIARVEAGEADPGCTECGGILKIDVISFGQMMPEPEVEKAYQLARECDVVLAIGSTLSVFPAAFVPLAALENGALFVIINEGETDQDHLAHIKLEGKAGQLLPQLVESHLG